VHVKLRVQILVVAKLHLLHVWVDKKQQAVCNISFQALDACLSSVSRLSLQSPGTCTAGQEEACYGFDSSSTSSAMTQDLGADQYANSLVFQCKFCSLGGGQKRYAALEVANTLFRVTFRLKNLRLADSIMKGVSHNLSPDSVTPFNNFPMSQQVTYKFFEGRIAIFNELYVSCSRKPHELMDILCCM